MLRFVDAQEISAYPLEALSELHTMAYMRACVLVALPAHFSRGCSCAALGGWSRSWCQNAYVVQPERAAPLRVEYTVSFIHHTRPLIKSPITPQILKISRPSILPEGSVRSSYIIIVLLLVVRRPAPPTPRSLAAARALVPIKGVHEISYE